MQPARSAGPILWQMSADRRVPRDDRADDADRLADEQAELAAARRWALLLARERVGERGVWLERAATDHRPAYWAKL